ncbi:MAG: hypothetical protein KAR20_25310, partial [Candidatus Heimdallarchaeota archaeon]|nr:hypothetical protein [Candidatus Heimdallarchaeota archaeon]
MIEENVNENEKSDEKCPEKEQKLNDGEKDLKKDMIDEVRADIREEAEIDVASVEETDDTSDVIDDNVETVQKTASEALYNELTDYIQKQIALINEKKEGKSVAKIYQNEDIVDALKFAQEFKSTQKINKKQLSINNFDDFCELVSKNKIISNFDINNLTL